MKNKKTRTFGTAADSYRTILRFQNSNAAIPPLRILFTLWVLCCGFVAAQSNDSSIISAARSNSTGSTSVSVPASSVYPALVNSSSDNGKSWLFCKPPLSRFYYTIFINSY